MIRLAKYLDELHCNGGGYINEAEINVSVSGINYEDALKVITHLECLSLQYSVFDEEGNGWKKDELMAQLQPFRITFDKPQPARPAIRILTLEGFRGYLIAGNNNEIWEVSYLAAPIITRSRAMIPWGYDIDFYPRELKRNPRTLVRDHSSAALVPHDVSMWLLEGEVLDSEDPAFIVWADAAIMKLISTLPNEIDEAGEYLKFSGPPRLKLKTPEKEKGLYSELTKKSFFELQSAMQWVFENDRESESKQLLLAAELARSSAREDSSISFIKEHICAALSGGKIAHAFAVSEISKDALKSLADLRKAVTEETAKLTEATRQVATAVAGSFAVGLGLLAAKASTSTHAWLLVALSVVAISYVAIVIVSGCNFLLIQKKLRNEWHSRLYRFIPDAEYERMVTVPTKSTEMVFWFVAGVGITIVAILMLCVIFYSLSESGSALRQTLIMMSGELYAKN